MKPFPPLVSTTDYLAVIVAICVSSGTQAWHPQHAPNLLS